MKKILSIFLALGSVFGLFTMPLLALTPAPGWTPATCAVNVEYRYNVQTEFSCVCPTGSTKQFLPNTTTGLSRFICTATTQTQTPMCQPAVPGKSYPSLAVQCKCPNGTVVWSNNGYTSQCNWNTNLPVCPSPVQGVPMTYVNYPCACPNGNTVTNTSTYASCYGLLTCWDGSLAPNQNYCPAHKYCPGDNVTKRPISYTCPVTTQTCWNGSVIPLSQACPGYKYCPGDSVTKRSLSYACPVQTTTCWNGQVVSIYQPCPAWTPPVKQYCSYYEYWNGYACVPTYNQYPPIQYDNIDDVYPPIRYDNYDYLYPRIQYDDLDNLYPSEYDDMDYPYSYWNSWDTNWDVVDWGYQNGTYPYF